MRIVLENRTGERVPVLSRSRLERACGRILLLPPHCEVTLTFVADPTMRALNRRTRGKDRTTDVLSFPLHSRRPYRPDPDGVARLGDIVIALREARRRARGNGISFQQAFQQTLVHGILHLVGYTHARRRDHAAMEWMARRILLSTHG